MLVVDASALVDVLTADPADIPDLARRLHDVDWMSGPELLDYEVLNVLRKMVRRGDIDDDFAQECRMVLRDLRVIRHRLTDRMSDRMWELRHFVSAYDAAYLALAEELQVPLVTVDHRLARAVGDRTAIPIETYS